MPTTEQASSHDVKPSYRILIVDDDRTTLFIAAHFFKQRGYQVSQAGGGAEAIEILGEKTFDLVILDVMMPDVDGWQVLQHLRKQFDEVQLPVIMYSATEDRSEIVRMFRAGANDYIPKPFETELTLARVESQLRQAKAQSEIRLSEERYALAARASNDGLWDWDLSTNLVYFSARWNEMFGLEEQECTAPPSYWLDRVPAEDLQRLMPLLHKIQEGSATQLSLELRLRHQDGSDRWVVCRGLGINSTDGLPQRITGSISDITGGKVADVLTGLPNRLQFRDRVSRSIESRASSPLQLCAVYYLDLDNFKFINDTFGHAAGDKVLIDTSNRLTDVISRFGSDSIAARFGGDEFGVHIHGFESEEELSECAKQIHQAIAGPILLDNGREIFTQASIGVSLLTPDTRNVDELLSQADIAMYDAKANGKGHTSIFDQSMRSRLEARLHLETELRKAIQKKSFFVEYQPIYDLMHNEVVGFEAFMRWNHPVTGAIPPAVFIPLAEELNLIHALGDWMIEEVCRQIAEWRSMLSRPLGLFVSINISSKQFAQSDFVEKLIDNVRKSQIDGRSIKLEITESVIMKNMDRATDMIRTLQGHGLRVAIDDFGTGFSSLAYLHQLPVNILKIAQCFIHRIENSQSGAPIVNTILALASNLSLAAVAEGVETQSQLQELKKLGCRYAQGNLFSYPLSSDETTMLVLSLVPTRMSPASRSNASADENDDYAEYEVTRLTRYLHPTPIRKTTYITPTID